MSLEDQNPRLERVGFELRASGVKPEQARDLRSAIHTRGYLPHVKREGAKYFATFRLADSLPKEVLLEIQAQRAERLRQLYGEAADTHEPGKQCQSAALSEIEREYFCKLERYLDKGAGECWLRRPAVAEQVAGALRFFDGERYLLKAWVIMANHVHAVLWPMPNYTLSSITQSWKRFTAREANKLLSSTGEAFWQPESYDHWIRNDVEHWRCCEYVINNPVKARLCDTPELWKWSSAWVGWQKK
jgi:REP-associated tyrosine transposase